MNLAQSKRYLRANVASHSHILEITKGFSRLLHVSDTNMTGILHPDDPRAISENRKTALMQEVEGQIKRNVLKFI